MIELELYWDGKLYRKVFAPVIPRKHDRVSFSDHVFHVEQVTFDFEHVANRYTMERVIVSGWPI